SALAAASGFPPGVDVYHVERVRVVEGRALILDVSYFLRSVVKTLSPEAAEQSIYAYLEKELGIQIMTSSVHLCLSGKGAGHPDHDQQADHHGGAGHPCRPAVPGHGRL